MWSRPTPEWSRWAPNVTFSLRNTWAAGHTIIARWCTCRNHFILATASVLLKLALFTKILNHLLCIFSHLQVEIEKKLIEAEPQKQSGCATQWCEEPDWFSTAQSQACRRAPLGSARVFTALFHTPVCHLWHLVELGKQMFINHENIYIRICSEYFNIYNGLIQQVIVLLHFTILNPFSI